METSTHVSQSYIYRPLPQPSQGVSPPHLGAFLSALPPVKPSYLVWESPYLAPPGFPVGIQIPRDRGWQNRRRTGIRDSKSHSHRDPNWVM